MLDGQVDLRLACPNPSPSPNPSPNVGHMLDGQVDLFSRHRWYAQQQELLGPVFRRVIYL